MGGVNMGNNELIRYLMQNDINLRIGMATAMGRTDQYVELLKAFFREADFEELHFAIKKRDKRVIKKDLLYLEKETLDLGMTHIYELLIEMDVLMGRNEFGMIDSLLEEALVLRNDIMTALELSEAHEEMPYGDAVMHRDGMLANMEELVYCMEKKAI